VRVSNSNDPSIYLSLIGFIVVGLVGGALLASTGVIGPFLVPALLLLGLSSDVARGTTLVSELIMTLVSVIGHNRERNLDKRIILAYLPGAATVVLGAKISLNFPELFMKLFIGVFEIVIGILMIMTTAKLVAERGSKNNITAGTMVKLMAVALLAGFTKGFFGAGWGPIGVGLFVLLGINPRIVVGSSLAIRLLLDVTGGATYASMNLVDVNAVVPLTAAGCIASLLAVELTKNGFRKKKPTHISRHCNHYPLSTSHHRNIIFQKIL